MYPAELVTMGDLSPEGKSVLHNESCKLCFELLCEQHR